MSAALTFIDKYIRAKRICPDIYGRLSVTRSFTGPFLNGSLTSLSGIDIPAFSSASAASRCIALEIESSIAYPAVYEFAA